MTSTNFCYWCQGKFEIDGKHLLLINGQQVKLIKQHLDMMFIHEPDTDNPFCLWLRDIFDMTPDVSDGWGEKQLEVVSKRLNLCFEHVIDPTLGDDEHQAKLDDAHNGTTEAIKPAIIEVEQPRKFDLDKLRDAIETTKPEPPRRTTLPTRGTNPNWGVRAKC